MQFSEQTPRELLKFQAGKDIRYLYKALLRVMEDVRNDHNFMIEKLLKEIPNEYHSIIRSCNHFDENQFAFIRKKILDSGNEAIRQIEGQIDKYNVSL